MKIISSNQIKELDQASITKEGITSIDLMERAAKSCLPKILNFSEENKTYTVFCGKGNNGGDGLAIARFLCDRNRHVNVYVINHKNNGSDDFEYQLKLYLNNYPESIHFINSEEEVNSILFEETIIIDALLGVGLNKPVDGLLLKCIKFINQSTATKISIDLPSGVSADYPLPLNECVIADYTLTFQQPKFSFMFPEIQFFTGKLEVIDIGLDKTFSQQLDTPFHYITLSIAKKLRLHRAVYAHKGTFGHALLIAGHKGMMGAAQISGRACLRAGAGLVTLKIPNCGLNIIQQSLPEALVITDEEEKYISSLPDLSKYNAIGIGCGIGNEKQTQNVLKLLIQNYSGKLLLDADALNCLSENKTWISFLPKYTIITPHPKEFDRLTGNHSNTYDRFQSALEFSKKHQLIIVLKGSKTACIMPDGNVFFNSTGNSGLAKGGSGDALAGIITGLLARGYAPNHAAILGVYLHGLAADLALGKNHEESLLITDVVEKLPKAFQKIYS
jgi:NAD(P)H-hydrate epimerase